MNGKEHSSRLEIITVEANGVEVIDDDDLNNSITDEQTETRSVVGEGFL